MNDMEYLKVEGNGSVVEVELEDDNTLLLESVHSAVLVVYATRALQVMAIERFVSLEASCTCLGVVGTRRPISFRLQVATYDKFDTTGIYAL